MSTRTLELTLDQELWEQIEREARRRKTTVESLVLEQLEAFVASCGARSAVLDEVRQLLENPPLVIGGVLPGRDALHDR